MTLKTEQIERVRKVCGRLGRDTPFKDHAEFASIIDQLCDMALEGEIHRRERALLAEAFASKHEALRATVKALEDARLYVADNNSLHAEMLVPVIDAAIAKATGN